MNGKSTHLTSWRAEVRERIDAAQRSAMTSLVPVDLSRVHRCPYCNHVVAKGLFAPGSCVQLRCFAAGCRQLVTVAAL